MTRPPRISLVRSALRSTALAATVLATTTVVAMLSAGARAGDTQADRNPSQQEGTVVTRSGSTVTTRIYDDSSLVAETIEAPGLTIERTCDSSHFVCYETRTEKGVTTFRRIQTRHSLLPKSRPKRDESG